MKKSLCFEKLNVVAVAVKSGFKRQELAAEHRSWLLCDFFVSLHCSILRYLTSWQVRFWSPNTSNLLPVQIEQTYVSRMSNGDPMCLWSLKFTHLCTALLPLQERKTSLQNKMKFQMLVLTGDCVSFSGNVLCTSTTCCTWCYPFLPEPHCSSTSMCQWFWLFGQFATVMR